MPLAQKVAVITGGSSGIGAAIARALARRGWQLVLLARSEERLAEVAREVGAEHKLCDVADRAEVERVAAGVRERHPAINLLVNNAGIPGRGGFLDLDPEQIEGLERTNYLGSVWCLRAFLPALEAAAPADLVNISSVAGTIAVGHSGPYSASKHAQLAFSRSVGVELAGRGITVHTVIPGFIHTPGFPNRSRFRNRMLQKIVAEPEFVAEQVVQGIERNRVEQFVPRWYRPAAIVQAAAPGSLARAARRLGTRKRPA
ncbi:MAG TPA: SDR family NAD(P)-dependent oxidoreductase [Gaiellaceae bacterium]|nr:SDR family NAD(P)-dependent oxidoreductase [Gaiellaceae bacterium]